MSPVATATAPTRAARPAPSRPRTEPSRTRRAPARPDLYVVEPIPTRSPASKGRLGMIAIGLLFVVAFAIAVLQTVLVQGQMHLDGLQQQISDQQAEAQRLRLEAASLASPANIVAEAEAMGMVAPAGGPTYVPTVPGDEPPATAPTVPPAAASDTLTVAATPVATP